MTCAFVAASLWLTGMVSPAQTSPTPSDVKNQIATERERYRIDFPKVFYASPEAEQADRVRAATLSKRLAALRGKVGASAGNLVRALTLNDQISAIQQRLGMFHHLKYMLDTAYQEPLVSAEDQGNDDSTLTGFLRAEIAHIPPATIDRYLRQSADLRRYRFLFAEMQREAPHELSPHDESLVRSLSPFASGWQAPLFETTRQGVAAGSIRKEINALALLRLSGALDQEAKLRHFSGATERTCFSLFLKRSQVITMFDALAEQRDLGLQFEELRRRHREGLAKEEKPPVFTLDEATRIVERALMPLGPEYGREYAALLDPANGRIDVAGGPRRSGLGTGWGIPPSQPSILYWPEYTGVYDDLDRGLAHEGGHAVHFQFMRRHGVPTAFTSGPGYFFESFAEFNQLLLADDLYRREADPVRKRFFLEQFIEKARYPLHLAVYAALEFAIHDGTANRTVQSVADLDRLERATLQRFKDPAAKVDADSPIWSRNETYYTHPLYNVNHLLGAVLALAYYAAYERDPATFVPKYLALLGEGFDAAPADLLRRFVGIDLNDPRLIARSTDLLRSKLNELKALDGAKSPEG